MSGKKIYLFHYFTVLK